MLNHRLILDRLGMLRNSVNRLKDLASLSAEAFLSDPDNYAIAEHHLRRALESVLDMGRHIVVKEGLGRPQDYRSVLEILGQYRIIPASFAGQIAGMAGYRNRLVPGYAEVTAEEIYHIITTGLDDFVHFARHILDYMEK